MCSNLPHVLRREENSQGWGGFCSYVPTSISVYVCSREWYRGVWILDGQGVVIGVCHQCCYQEEVLVHVLWHEVDVLVSVLVTVIPFGVWHQKCGFLEVKVFFGVGEVVGNGWDSLISFLTPLRSSGYFSTGYLPQVSDP